MRCTLIANFGHFEQRTLCCARAVCEAKLSSLLAAHRSHVVLFILSDGSPCEESDNIKKLQDKYLEASLHAGKGT